MEITQGSMLKPMCTKLVFKRVRSECYSSLRFNMAHLESSDREFLFSWVYGQTHVFASFNHPVVHTSPGKSLSYHQNNPHRLHAQNRCKLHKNHLRFHWFEHHFQNHKML